ncbi:MAG: 50S ribosomal protein L11 methyltransferase [Candidatus Omnitrophica bacterium]|nr:50S ribosomal protein L11 methyltransferase [Candidatus Omnitrophota bacterium]
MLCFFLIVETLISTDSAFARRLRSYTREAKQAIMLSHAESRRLGEEVIRRLGIEKSDIKRTMFMRKEWQEATDEAGEKFQETVMVEYDAPYAEIEFDCYDGSDDEIPYKNFRYLRFGPLVFINYEAKGTSLEKIREKLGEDFLKQYGQNIIFYTKPAPWQPRELSEFYPLPLPFIDRTTLVVVAHLLKNGVEGKVVADIGAGNGILSIVALRLGAKKIVALESDPECIEKAEEVAYINGYVAGKDIIFISHYIDSKDDRNLGLPKSITESIEVVVSNTGPMYRHLPLQIIKAAGSWPACREIALTSYRYIPVIEREVVSEQTYIQLMKEVGFINADIAQLGFKLEFVVNGHDEREYFVDAYLLCGRAP